MVKPILFNTEMVRAILGGRKTQTRRAVKAGYLRVLDSPYHREHPEVPDKVLLEKLCEPPYQPGDILYVRETWAKLCGDYIYKANQKPNMLNPGKWHPSIHMPKEAARIWLRMTAVRAERLQEITVTGLQAEGIVPDGYISQYTTMTDGDKWFQQFHELWDSTINPTDRERYGWDANPWVWVIEFERCEKPKEVANNA